MPVHDNLELVRLIEGIVPGRNFTLTVFRDRRANTLTVRAIELLDRRQDQQHRETIPYDEVTGYHDVRLGLALDEISADLADALDYPIPSDGVVVTYVQPQSFAAKEGLCAGMVVFRIGNEPIRTVNDFKRMMTKQSLERGILMLIGTPQQRHFVLLREMTDAA